MKRPSFWGGFLGSVLGPTLTRLTLRFGKYILIGAAILTGLFVRWWQQQDRWVHALIVTAVVGLLVWVVQRKVRGWTRRPQVRPEEPTQVLYRYYEPTDLPDGQVCFCGKPRRPGELVYIGITGAHRSRELDDDRKASCWWRAGLVGTTETYLTRDAVEAAERRAIRAERPRENVVYARGLR